MLSGSTSMREYPLLSLEKRNSPRRSAGLSLLKWAIPNLITASSNIGRLMKQVTDVDRFETINAQQSIVVGRLLLRRHP